MNGSDSLSVVLDELAPLVEPEEVEWDDVLVRAGLLTSEPDIQRRGTRSRRHRRLSAVFIAAVAVAVAASALAVAGVNPLTALLNFWNSPANPGPLAGSYSSTLSGLKPTSLNGHWTITFAPYSNAANIGSAESGSYVLSQNGKVMESGSFTFGGGNQFSNFNLTDTGGPAECPASRIPGGYEIKYDSSALKLQSSFDQCARRRIVLSSKVFVR
jgi:hypothetical protein